MPQSVSPPSCSSSFTLGLYEPYHDYITASFALIALTVIPQIFMTCCCIGFIIELTHTEYPIFVKPAQHILMENSYCGPAGCSAILPWIFRLKLDPVQETVMTIMMICEHLIHSHGAHPLTVASIGILSGQRLFILLTTQGCLSPNRSVN